ncbi:hypothetical protein ACHAXT_009888 [Thalassiosira profunda]
MRAARCTDYSDTTFEDVLTVEENVETPKLGDEPPSGFKARDAMLVRVLSVALAPGDVRVMSGLTREFQGPPSFPYTPGGDVCGIVEAVPAPTKKGACRFKVGDRIAARFDGRPMGMLGEYALVSPNVADVVPPNLSAEEASALASSGTVAVLLADRIREGDRVLIFGAGGGRGQPFVPDGASYVAGVGKDAQRLTEKPLGCDEAIDYTTTNPFDVHEWKEDPFDVIIDLSSGVWPKLLEQRSARQPIIKPAKKGGRYLTLTPDNPKFELHSAWAIMKCFLFPCTVEGVLFSLRILASYSYVLALPGTSGVVTRTLWRLRQKGKLAAVVDPKGPFPFTTQGVRDAFVLQKSRHIQGKVVISVAKE